MEKCKNTECNNETVGKNVYCSLKCRNVFVNKNLRDYSKISLSLSGEKDYYLNPKKCIKCNSILNYEQRTNVYCSHSCSASETNKSRKGIKHKLTEQGRRNLVECANNNFSKFRKSSQKHEEFMEKFIKNPTFCKCCNKSILYKYWLQNRIFCDVKCRNIFREKDLTDFQKYKRDCLFDFNLSDFEEEFDFGLIKEHGWYSPSNKKNNLNGVSRDHMYSIRDGFDNNIEQFLIAHPANCKLILQRENSSKHKKSSITISELKKRIKNWNKKYNNGSVV